MAMLSTVLPVILALLWLSASGCNTPTEPEAQPEHEQPPTPIAEGTPRLVLFVVLDQARYDYLERFRPLFSSGLARLLDESLNFTDAHHAHAMTATGPGHASLATGTHPARHGVIGNAWLDRETGNEIYCAEDDDEIASPARLLTPTLGDRIKAAWPEAKVFTAAGKDRAAILTAGTDANAAFWYDRDTGRFTTSEIYLDFAPPWFNAFHDQRLPDAWFGQPWQLQEATVNAMAQGRYGIEPLRRAPIEHGSPRAIGGAGVAPGEYFYGRFLETPMFHDYLVDFALALIDGEQLGSDAVPDFLGLGFSSLDYIGHDYGPDSPEVLDTLLHLDLQLGRLFDELEERRLLSATVISVSSDHGVLPIPEVARQQGNKETRRLSSADALCYQRAGQATAAELANLPRSMTNTSMTNTSKTNTTTATEAPNSRAIDWLYPSGLYFRPTQLTAHGIEPAKAQEILARHLEACDGVARVWRHSELMAGAVGLGEEPEPYALAYLRGFHAERSPDLFIQLDEHVLYSMSTETSHGTAYPHDTHVPWLLRLPDAEPGQGRTIDDRVHTVDVATTLAAMLSLPTDGMDGEDRRSNEP